MPSDEIIDMDSGGRVVPNREQSRKGQSLAGLSRNKSFQEFVRGLLDRNAENIERWLMEVAEGKPTQIVQPDPENGIPGGIIPGTDPDPAKAVDLIVKLAEFSEPKQGRVLVANDPDNPFMQPVLNVTIGGKKISVEQGSTTPQDGN